MLRPHGNLSTDTGDAASATDDASPTVRAVGALVRQLRGEQNLSLANLAAAAGLSPGLLSQIERGMGNPSLTTLIKLAHALGVPVGRFFVSEQPAHALVRKGEHPRLQIADTDLIYELLTSH